MQIIFHSDDLGATHSMTQRILEAWEAGLLDGFSIMANGDAVSEVRSGLLSQPERDARVVAHLNLNEGRSLLQPSEVPLLVDTQGYFALDFTGVLKLWLRSSKAGRESLLQQVEREWRAQIRKVKEICHPRKVTGVDSHTHIHMIPFLFGVAAKLAVEEGITEIRICREPFHPSSRFADSMSLGFLVNIVKHVVLQVFSPQAGRIIRERELVSPGAMIGVLYSGMMTKSVVESGIRAAERRGMERFEILMHIGRAAEEELGRWRGDRKAASFVMDYRRDTEYADLARLRREA